MLSILVFRGIIAYKVILNIQYISGARWYTASNGQHSVNDT